MQPQISIVVPTYKRPLLLTKCLHALVNQSLFKEYYEIIVVTDGPDEETVISVNELRQQFISCPEINCISLPCKKGPAAARNAGWRGAKGDLILFTDDDCIPLFLWAESYLKAFVYYKKEEIAFSGKIKVPLPENPTDHEKNTSLLEQAEFVTANCACTKKALEKIGGLDEEFTMAWREDSALEFGLIEHQIPIIKINEALIIHPVRKARWGISIKEQKKTMFDPLLYKKHPKLYKKKINARPPWYYYGTIILSIALIITAICGQHITAYIFFVGWICLTALFTGIRLRGASLGFMHVLEMFLTSLIIPFLSVYWRLYGSIRYKTLLL